MWAVGVEWLRMCMRTRVWRCRSAVTLVDCGRPGVAGSHVRHTASSPPPWPATQHRRAATPNEEVPPIPHTTPLTTGTSEKVIENLKESYDEASELDGFDEIP